MRRTVRTNRFKKDIERARRRGKDLSKVRSVMKALIEERPLHARYRNHPLISNYAGRHECHIEPDWLLILEPGTIIFERTGAHSDIFR